VKGGKIAKPNPRRERVATAMREALTEAIAADVRDPRVHAVQMLTVSRVELNVDMAVANVYVSIVGDERAIAGALAGLAKAAGFLRGPVGRTLGLQHAPELRFLLDQSIDMKDKLAEILREDELKARAAGRIPGQAEPVAVEPVAVEPATVDAPVAPVAPVEDEPSGDHTS
jgi:ribosome-binding factor A